VAFRLPLLWTAPILAGKGSGWRERGGRARLQNGDRQDKLPTTFVLYVCASHSRFQPMTRDPGRCRQMPDFALSRRQRGFESRWGYGRYWL
jgi:hypothetical protein